MYAKGRANAGKLTDPIAESLRIVEVLFRVYFLQFLRDPAPIIGPSKQKLTMLRGQSLRKVRALFGVAPALRSVHKRHHWLEGVTMIPEDDTIAVRVPKVEVRSRNRERSA